MTHPPEFAHIKHWVFDLDNTLYPPDANLFAQIDQRMTDFIQSALGVSKPQAYRLQKHYWADYGTTLAGLMQEHHIAPTRFLEFVHDIDVSVLSSAPELRTAIAALDGQKFIFTNGTRTHAIRITEQLGLADLFTDIFDIETGDYVPKPDASIYPKMLARFGIKPTKAALFEDLARNLLPAHALGMATIWVRPDPDNPDYNRVSHEGAEGAHIHHITDDLTAFLRTLSCDKLTPQNR